MNVKDRRQKVLKPKLYYRLNLELSKLNLIRKVFTESRGNYVRLIRLSLTNRVIHAVLQKQLVVPSEPNQN